MQGRDGGDLCDKEEEIRRGGKGEGGEENGGETCGAARK